MSKVHSWSCSGYNVAAAILVSMNPEYPEPASGSFSPSVSKDNVKIFDMVSKYSPSNFASSSSLKSEGEDSTSDARLLLSKLY